MVWTELGMLLRNVSLMYLFLILFHPFSTQWREPNLGDFVETNLCWLAFRHVQAFIVVVAVDVVFTLMILIRGH